MRRNGGILSLGFAMEGPVWLKKGTASKLGDGGEGEGEMVTVTQTANFVWRKGGGVMGGRGEGRWERPSEGGRNVHRTESTRSIHSVTKCRIWVHSHAPSIRSHRGIKVVWPDFQPMRVPEEPVCVHLFRQKKPVFTSLHLKSPVHVHRLWKRLRRSGIDSNELIPPRYIGHRPY